jgi:pimeloyl-ACP methyl ester carboxylesterase
LSTAFEAIAFAGGGNRCYWQGGFWKAAAPALGLQPKMVVGVSGGAWAATYSLLGLGDAVRDMVVDGCSKGVRNIVWNGLRPSFPVAGMYRELIETIIDEQAFARLRQGPELLIAIARSPRRLPLPFAVGLGLLTYQVEKKLHGPVHPRGGRALGFRSDYLSLAQIESRSDLVAALMASASVPPFMPVGLVGGVAALDGGLVDNVPVEPLAAVEARGGKTLVLLTRRYKALPNIPHRTYVQPTHPIPIGQFDITRPEAILAAYEQGMTDGAAFAASWSSRSASSAIDPST